MEQRQAIASIDVSWATLRYAEVEHDGAQRRPLRLGSCVFDFDVTRELLQAETPAHHEAIAEALRDVLGQAPSRRLRVVIHPPAAHAFVTVLPKAMAPDERDERVRQDAALLVGPDAADTLHVTTTPVHAPAHLDVAPTQVLAVPDAVHAHIRQATAPLPHTEVEWMLSTQAAAQVAAFHQTMNDTAVAETDLTVCVGSYPEHVEFGLLRGGQWYYSHYVDVEAPEDVAYFALALFNHLDLAPADVTTIALYGIGADVEAAAPLETIFGVTPTLLDPMALLGLDASAVHGDFGAAAYVPCIGAAL